MFVQSANVEERLTLRCRSLHDVIRFVLVVLGDLCLMKDSCIRCERIFKP